jgi:7-cyano-7-deazaguanine synthase
MGNKINQHRAIVLLSGGMDSLVTAAVAVRDIAHFCFLHVNYGQRTESKELECFQNLVRHYRPEQHLVIDMEWLGKIGGSALTDVNIDLKEEVGTSSVPATYVPFRNANFIAAAVSWAEVIQADRIYIGAVEEDSSGYPDCRESFYREMQKAVSLGTKSESQIELVTPVIHLNKSDIVILGTELKAPFLYSWSCYTESDLACGECASCRLRLKAFREAGIPDPIPYATRK